MALMSSIPSTAETTPAKIHADRPGSRLEIEWRDGHQTVFDFMALRWLCPCAICRGEGGMPGWLDSNPTLTSLQTTLVDARLVGAYALQPIWADGHSTGYYSFTDLRQQCPCPACAAARAASAGRAGQG
jgi:DUF971 family protein